MAQIPKLIVQDAQISSKMEVFIEVARRRYPRGSQAPERPTREPRAEAQPVRLGADGAGRLFTWLLYFRAVRTVQAFEKWSGRRGFEPATP